MKVVGLFWCESEMGKANMDVINLFTELSKKHKVYLFLLTHDENNNIYSIRIFSKKVKHLFFLDILRIFIRILRIRPNVIIVDSVYLILFPLFFVCKILRIPFIVYCREIFSNSYIILYLTKYILQKADIIVAIDDGLKRYFENLCKRKVILVPASVNLKLFQESEKKRRDVIRKYRLPQDCVKVIYSGTISKFRNVELLIDAFEYISKKNLNIILLITGIVLDKNYYRYLRNKIIELNLRSKVYLLPNLPYSDVLSLMQVSDICIDPFPKYGLEEFQLSLKILEYMAAGKPIIAIKASGNRIINQAKCGFLVKPNAKAMARKILFLANNPKLRDKLGRNAKNVIKKYYDSRKVSRRFDILLKKLGNGEYANE